jgi:hypothetical protein
MTTPTLFKEDLGQRGQALSDRRNLPVYILRPTVIEDIN